MSEPEKEEASKGFEVDVWLAMVVLLDSIWIPLLWLYACKGGVAASTPARRLDVYFQAKAHTQCRQHGGVGETAKQSSRDRGGRRFGKVGATDSFVTAAMLPRGSFYVRAAGGNMRAERLKAGGMQAKVPCEDHFGEGLAGDVVSPARVHV